MNHLLLSIRHFITGFGDIKEHGVVKFVLLPGLITSLLFLAIYYLTAPILNNMESWIINLYPLEWGRGVINWIVHSFSFLLWIGGFMFLFKYFLFIVMSPFMSIYSERIENRITSEVNSSTFSIHRLTRELFRGLRVAIRNFSYEMVLVVILLILSFVPGFQIVTAPLIFIVQAYYAGAGNFDYVLERKYNAKESIKYNRNHRSLLVGNGALFLLLLSVPILGWFLAAPLATSSATRSFVAVGIES